MDEVPILKAPKQTTARCGSSKPRGLREAAGTNRRGGELAAMVSRFWFWCLDCFRLKLKTKCNWSFSSFSAFCHYHSCLLVVDPVIDIDFVSYFSAMVSTQQSRLFAITSTSFATNKTLLESQKDLWPGHATIGSSWVVSKPGIVGGLMPRYSLTCYIF